MRVKKTDYDRYPVAPGDVWVAGPHILACGDFERGAGEAVVWRTGSPSVFCYSDPPWDSGIARNFRTQAGVGCAVDFQALLTRFLLLVQRVSPALSLVEMGCKETPRLAGLAVASGATVLADWPISYYMRSPARLLALTWAPPATRPVLTMNPGGMDDEHTPAFAVEHLTKLDDWVFDPCMGRGLTLRAAHTLGRRAVGLELVPRRLSCALSWLADQGLKPEKVGVLP
jgi:hypothetical protein